MDIKEGFKRLYNFFMVENYKHTDSGTVLLGGGDLWLDKITLGELMQTLKLKLNCSDSVSKNFGRHIFERSSESIEKSYKEQSGDHIVVQLEQKIQKFKIV